MLSGALQILVFFGLLLLTVKPMGSYMARVFSGEIRWMGWLERPLYRLLGTDPEEDQPWTRYALSMLAFSLAGLLLSYCLLRLQGMLPMNPGGLGAKQMPDHLAFNTSVSFATNTNWQSYSPDVTVSNSSNMVALAIHNWMSAATGIAVAVALVRGFARRSAQGIGNFWVDTVRATLYVLLPLAFVGALIFVAAGVPQTFDSFVSATGLEGAAQKIALGPVASQEIIKHLGTNGGGFFNANSAHPFENPTALSDLFTKLLIFLIPASMTYMFGRMVGNVRQGWAIFAAMSVMFLAGAFGSLAAESAGNPAFASLGVETMNMEGKETRFGIGASTLFATVTTAASCGAVNAMHDSFTPLGGLVPTFNMMTGEVIFGGVGAGLYGMLVYAVLAVFIAGLMVGRTPEYLGKKIEKFEVQMAMLAVLVLAGSILGFSALATNLDLPKEGAAAALNTWPGGAYGGADNVYGATVNNLNNSGAHGFTEILYSYTSATANNGSAFAGITANTPFYNLTLGLAMLIGRFLMIVPLLAIAGNLARKKYIAPGAGTFATDNGTFVTLLIGTVLLIGALTFLPALALGPVVEHFQMMAGPTK
ncbi:potassium-transporting ATPase subunit KdpA [bacterium]|nr:MAG: potassium-transporting ATPase subunit KdpA [bacterium]